ncbi:MAG: GTPase HflX [Magnetococcales bacterium]|nr:GTPase HflX [Magnetococcales bacterium]
MFETHVAPERALLVQAVVQQGGRELAERLCEELYHLTTSAALVPLDRLFFSISQIAPGAYFGRGQVERIAEVVQDREVDVVVVNHTLSPVQQRNLERALKVKVVDRTGLILEIFASRARTREGRMQVQLASLIYQQSRLVRSWTHLERQRGGVGLRGGPGEAQIEIDRRLIRQRIAKLKRALKEVARTRALQRAPRRDVPLFTAALVGYTNAGKSTLFNRLSGAEVGVKDQLFATLDPTMRGVVLPQGGKVVLGDTVGFIRDLPHALVSAFRATLEEVCEADLLIQVVDISDPDHESQMEAVQEVLEELEVHRKPMLTLFNKVDLLENGASLAARLRERDNTLVVSAQSGEGLDAFLAVLEREVSRSWHHFQLSIPVWEGALMARLHQEGRVVRQREEGDHMHLDVALPEASAGRLQAELTRFARTDHSDH